MPAAALPWSPKRCANWPNGAWLPTKEIAQVIRQVQADTSESVKYGEQAAQEAKASMELSAIAGNALTNIVRSIEQTSALMSTSRR